MQGIVPHWGSSPGGPASSPWGGAGEVGGSIRVFSGVRTNNYWSSSSYANDPSNAWNVNLNNGNVNANNKTNSLYVWPVRGGE